MEDETIETSGPIFKESVHTSFWNYSSDNKNTSFTKSDSYSDPSFWVLVIANLLVIIIIAINKLTPLNILFVFVTESAIIGFFHTVLIFCLKTLDLEGLNPSLLSRVGSLTGRFFSACCFLISYGVFHGILYYLILIYTRNSHGVLISPAILLIIGILFINYLFSFDYLFKERTVNQDSMMAAFMYYYRAIITYLPLILMSFGAWAIFPTLLLRAWVSVSNHLSLRREKKINLIDANVKKAAKISGGHMKSDITSIFISGYSDIDSEFIPEDKPRAKIKINRDMLIDALHDPTFLTLLFSNLYVIYAVFVGSISLFSMLIIYWFQSMIIGMFNYIRMLNLKGFTRYGINSSRIDPLIVRQIRSGGANSFLLSYIWFSLGYIVFILIYGFISGEYKHIIWLNLLPLFIIFFLNHLYSFIHSFKEQTTNQDIIDVENKSFNRVLPMHVVILFIFIIGKWSVLPLLFLKTYFDATGHILKHVKK